MVQYSNTAAEICIVGRCWFETGIGSLTYSYCEMLARSFPVCILPTEPELRGRDEIVLPNGRSIPVWKGQALKASVFVDVLWNGTYDHNFELMPETGLRLACVVFDSDLIPAEWINILNSRFDGAICTSPHLEAQLIEAGIQIPIAVMPPALDLEPLLRRPGTSWRDKLRIGSVAAFHPRKATSTLISAFAAAFGNRDDVELVLHSNLTFADTVKEVERQIAALRLGNVVVSTSNLKHEDKVVLLETFSVFANFSRGEGYSIGAREALALGCVAALSDVGGHSDLSGCPGVFLAPARLRLPGRYVEIDNRIFGEQRGVTLEDAIYSLKQATAYVTSGAAAATRSVRRARAGENTFAKSTTAFAELINPAIRSFRKSAPAPRHAKISPEFRARVMKRIASAGGLTHHNARVIPAHDGGFFSIFNTYFSHLVWDLKDDRCHRVLPDWDVSRFIERRGGQPATSFCYGRPEDGNIWTSFFEPLFGLTRAEMDDRAEVYRNAAPPDYLHNDHREPQLTYVNAYKLYHAPWFVRFRRQYHRVYREHIRLLPDLEAEIQAFLAQHGHNRILLGAHVRHPSHAMEQPEAAMAHTESYLAALNRQIADIQDVHGDRAPWKIFLATDQQSVIRRFRAEFGQRVCFFSDVRRTFEEEDIAFHAKGSDQQRKEGHQVQHLMAASIDTWSTKLAWEVIRDAVVLSRCRSLLHVVSNISTAVSYMNPECKLIYCAPNIPLDLVRVTESLATEG